MDPDSALQELRKLVNSVRNGGTEDAYEIAMIFDTLDDWITYGGFLPTDWQ